MEDYIPGSISIEVPEMESFDPNSNSFIKIDKQIFTFQHSLKSISKWEAKYKKPFLSEFTKKTKIESLDYYLMMALDSTFDASFLTGDITEILGNYVNEEFSATTIRSNNNNDSNSRRVMTSEVIYAYMANAQVPFECENWNISRLLKLLNVISELNTKQKPMSESEIIAYQKALNKKRKEEIKKIKEERLKKQGGLTSNENGNKE